MKHLETLLQTMAPSGAEDARREVIEKLAAPFADEITTDALGNLIVHKKGDGDKVMLSAHMDTIGMLATRVENGFVRFGALGGLSVLDLQNIPVKFENGVEGVLSYDGKVPAKERKLHHCFIDIGDASVQVGDRAVFSGDLRKLGEHKICAPYLDNTLGCALLLQVLQELSETEYDLYFVFTVQEEVGLRGAKTAAFGIQPRFALAVDVTDTGDLPETDVVMETKLGGGAAIKIMDRSIVCHPKMVAALRECAEKNGIACQSEVLTAGGCDAGAIHLSGSGVITGGVSIPIRYVHSPCETADLRDCAAAVALLKCVLEQSALI